uniref:Selenoprotein H n=1 Tax=Mus musculus TaxID=10090 RepID=A0A087WNU1_MOUSE
MAPHGRKRKAGAAPMETVDKREKLAEGATVVIEHCTSCRVYGRHAAALSQALQLEAPELPVQVNPSKPRRGSFEVLNSGLVLRRALHESSNFLSLKRWLKN